MLVIWCTDILVYTYKCILREVTYMWMQTRTSEGGVDGTPFPPSIMLRYFIWFLPCYDVNIMGYIHKWCCWGTSDVIQHGRPFFQILHFFHYYFWHFKRTVVMKLNRKSRK